MSLRQHVGNISRVAVSIIRTRLELFALEAGEQKASFIKLMVMLFAALLFSTLALLVFSLLIALAFWPTEYRYWAIGLLMMLYAGIAIGLFVAIAMKLKRGALPFQATLDELGRDIQMLDQLRSERAGGRGDEI